MKISKATIIRTVMTLLVMINFILERSGIDIIKTNESAVMMFVECAIEVGVVVSSWWYNNSFSQKALKAQQYFSQLKGG